MRTRPKKPFIYLAVINVLVMICIRAHSAQANGSDIAALCDQAAHVAARSEHVPLDILQAVARTETGRRLNGVLVPWPWAANAGGEGDWFDSRDDALRHVETILASGRRNVDIGCFQLNHRWHAEGFESLGEMIDPAANAQYAARFLQRLHDEFGDWEAAVAAYHSRTPTHAARYLRRFQEIFAGLADTPPQDARPARTPVSGLSPLSLETRPSLLTRAGGLNAQGAAPLLSAQPARPLFGDRP